MDPTAPKKKGSRHNPQHTSWSIHGSIPSFSPKPTNGAVDLSQASVDDKLLGLLGPYHQHAIGTFNTCSRGPTHRSLTDTGRGYNLAGAGLPTPLLDLPNWRSYTFHLMALPGLRLSINSLPSELKGDRALNLMSGSLHSTSTITYHLSIAWANDVPPRIGLTRINRNVIFNVTTTLIQLL
jgi:hypothetical protein